MSGEKQTGVRVVNTTLSSSTATQVLGPGNGRDVVILSCTASINVTYSWSSGVTDGVGMYMQTNATPIVIRRCDIGSAIDLPLWAIAASGTPTVAVTEIL